MGVSEKRSLRYVVEPRSIHMNTCAGFLRHAEAQKKNIKQKPKNRNADKGLIFMFWGNFQLFVPTRIGPKRSKRDMAYSSLESFSTYYS